MSQVRPITCNDVEGRDFAPSEMYLVVLTQDETTIMCKAALEWDMQKPEALQRIFNASFLITREILA